MTLTKEDLLAISELIDEKLESIKAGQTKLEQGQAKLERGQIVMRKDIAAIKRKVEEIGITVGAICDWIDEPEPRPKKLV